MMNQVLRVIDHPAPYAVLGGICIVLALAQNAVVPMLLGFWGLVIAIQNNEDLR